MAWPKSSTPSLGISISAARNIRGSGCGGSEKSSRRFSPPRTAGNASAKVWPASALEEDGVEEVGLADAVQPRDVQVSGPNRTSTSLRFLKPFTSRRVSIASPQSPGEIIRDAIDLRAPASISGAWGSGLTADAAEAEEVAQHGDAGLGEHRFGMELHAPVGQVAVAHGHQGAVFAFAPAATSSGGRVPSLTARLW